MVLITGASSGIGRASTRAFVEHGDRVVAIARDAERLDALSAELVRRYRDGEANVDTLLED